MADNQQAHSGFSPMSNKIFQQFSGFIQDELGIKMPEAKRTMLQARLQKRLRKLGIETFEEYFNYVFSDRGMKEEMAHMIDAVTTNKTDFFREPQHFDYLVQKVLPEMIKQCGAGVRRPARIWSAGCSTGEEPYTLAMVLSEFSNYCPDFRFMILATDISTKVLREGSTGIYNHDKVEPVPLALRKKYLLRSKDKEKEMVRIVPWLRKLITFRRLNFMDPNFGMRETMDIVFCRNVLIYFDRETQENVLTRVCRHLIPGGYLFTGHSETLNGLNVPLAPVVSTVYRRIP
jgi:chemotaxis protein methyltransferase CheR